MNAKMNGWQLIGATAALLALASPILVRAHAQDANPSQQSDASGQSKQTDDDSEKAEKTKHNVNTARKNAKLEPERAAAADQPAVLVRDSGDDVAMLDLFDGIGGKENAPDPNDTYTFLDEDLSQTQAKVDIRDSQGRRWRAKMGVEAQPETAASRVVFAAGYYTDADYYVPQVRVKGLPHLKRGEQFVGAGGVLRGVRLKLMPEKEKNIGYWKWPENPFANTRELNGLRVVMALMNNWDLVTRNNKIYETSGERRFVVSDLGASFGRSGHEVTRSKGKLADYESSRFIVAQSADYVDFHDASRPLPIMALGIHYYGDLVEGEKVVEGIPRADARWMGQRLAQLSDDQIRDCFRAAGYAPEEIEGYTKVMRARISELSAL